MAASVSAGLSPTVEPYLYSIACTVRSGQTPEATVHTITKRVTTAWFERHLRDNAAVAPWLAAPLLGTPTSLRTTAPGC